MRTGVVCGFRDPRLTLMIAIALRMGSDHQVMVMNHFVLTTSVVFADEGNKLSALLLVCHALKCCVGRRASGAGAELNPC